MRQASPLWSLAVLISFLVACNPNSVGLACINPNGDKPSGTQISSPALECGSRLCLIQATNADSDAPDGGNAFCTGGRCTCTAECSSNDDCAAATREFCAAGFVCAVATPTGPFCCKKLCVCKDDLDPSLNEDQSGNVITPFGCDPKTPGALVTCANVAQ